MPAPARDRGQAPTHGAERPRELGIRLICLYKAIKAVAQLAGAVALVVLAARGKVEGLRDFAHHLQAHVGSKWGMMAGRALSAALSRHGVHLIEAGLAADAVLSAFEGWSLWRGYRWGPWLVVAATAVPLPVEVVEIARAPHATRIAVAVVNVAVVAYLARRLRARHRARHGGG